MPKFFQFTSFNALLAMSASLSLFLISPAASGSGIPDVKAYLNGVETPAFRQFFSLRTFVAKVVGSALAVGSRHASASHCAICYVPCAAQLLLPDWHATLNSDMYACVCVCGTFEHLHKPCAVCLPCGVRSLIMGKEGPMLHAGSILAVILGVHCSQGWCATIHSDLQSKGKREPWQMCMHNPSTSACMGLRGQMVAYGSMQRCTLGNS